MTGKLDLPLSRIELVQESIRRSILSNEFRPGQPLVEADLAQRLGVSKTPVREALKMLASSGLVQFVPYKGARVQAVESEFIAAACDLRLLIEPEAIRRTVLSGARDGLLAASAALDEARRAIAAGDRVRLSVTNRDFHALLYRDCGNHLLRDVLDNLRDRVTLISVVGWNTADADVQPPLYEVELHEHQAMLDAALAGDADRAAALLTDHIQGFFDRMMAKADSPTWRPAG
jgi:DNA-binding GntR family transcriptional regulator